jgi:DNA-binding beta-propeller fold protein YncE
VRRLVAALVATAACALALAPASPAAYRHVRTWGHLGGGPGEFGSGVLGGGANRQYDDPAGIAVSADGRVFVVDTSNNRVQEFTGTGAFRNSFGSRGRDNGAIRRVIMAGRFFQPAGIAIGSGQLFVIDAGNDRVMVHSAGGGFLRRIGHHGSRAGQWIQPWGAATSGDVLYVVDQGNYRIQRRSLGGALQGEWGGFGRKPGRFVTPYGVAVSRAGDRVYVTDAIRRKVLMFDPTGSFLGEFGRSGRRGGRFLKPTGVAVGPDGTVFVADRCRKRIVHFNATGRFIESFGRRSLRAPTFLDVDAAGTIYVSDRQRVVVFAPRPQRLEAPEPAPEPAEAARWDVACTGIRG